MTLKAWHKILIAAALLMAFAAAQAQPAADADTLVSVSEEVQYVAAMPLVTKPLAVIPDQMLEFDADVERRHNRVPIYALPYSMTYSDPNWKRMWINTGALFTAGLATIGILECLPEDATAWNKSDRRPLFRRWVDHVTSGPVMDHDNAIFNYVLHPYGGAAYYMSARSQGFNVLQSFVYSAAVSTFFWEYGIEAFMEIPSIQDLFITPIVGSAIGEGFYMIKRHIVSNGYELWGSPVLGNIVAFLVDPVNEVVGWIAGSDTRGLFKRPGSKMAWTPVFSTAQVGFTFTATF